MLYLGIDQHARQITVSLRNDAGDVLLARQVSTQPEKIRAFLQQLTGKLLSEGEGFLAVLEVCGFNDWLVRLLEEHHCRKVILIQPEERQRRKTDRRDAAALSELLWVNRDRFLSGKPVRGLRQVELASLRDQENRRLTTFRKEASQGTDPDRQQNQTPVTTPQSAMGSADQDISHPTGRGMAPAGGVVRDRPVGDG
jgi:transposase